MIDPFTKKCLEWAFIIVCVVYIGIAIFPYETFDDWNCERLARKYPDKYSQCEHCGDWRSHKDMTDLGWDYWVCYPACDRR